MARKTVLPNAIAAARPGGALANHFKDRLNETLAELEQVRALVRILLFDGADVSETEARIALKEWCMEGQEAAA